MMKSFRSVGLVLAAGLLVTAGCCTKKPAPAPAPEVAVEPTPAPVPVPTEAPIAVPVAEPVPESLPADLEELNKRGYLKDIFFDFDLYDVRADARDPMASNADWLKKWPTVQIQIQGHCDERGSNKYNMALGDKRANAARDYLISLGIDGSRVSTISYGEERPFVEGQNEEAWSQNRRAPLAGALLFAFALTGCVSGSDIEGLHRHVGDVEKKVERLAQQSSSKEEVDKLNQNLTAQVTTILRSNADMGTRFDELTRELQGLAGKLEDANRRLSQLSQQIAEAQAPTGATSIPPDSFAGTGSTPVAGAPPTSGGAVTLAPGLAASLAPTPKPSSGRPAPADLYNQALGDYQRGRFDLARQGFEEYVDTYPRTDLSDDALFWAAECWSAQKEPRKALEAYDRLLKAYPQSEKAPSAHLRKGLAHLELGEKAQSIVQLQFVVYEYPTSDEAKSARQHLRALGSDSR